MYYHYKTVLSSAIQIHIKVHTLFSSKLIVAIMYGNTSLLLFFIIYSIKRIQLNILHIYSTSSRQISNSLRSLKMSLHCPMETVFAMISALHFHFKQKMKLLSLTHNVLLSYLGYFFETFINL